MKNFEKKLATSIQWRDKKGSMDLQLFIRRSFENIRNDESKMKGKEIKCTIFLISLQSSLTEWYQNKTKERRLFLSEIKWRFLVFRILFRLWSCFSWRTNSLTICHISVSYCEKIERKNVENLKISSWSNIDFLFSDVIH